MKVGSVAGGVLFAVLLSGGCGDTYDLPALAATEAPPIRVLLGGRKRKTATLRILGQHWKIASVAGAAYERSGRNDVTMRIRPGSRGIRIENLDTGATKLRVRTDRDFDLEGIRYAGDLLLLLDGPSVRFVNELDLESYVAGVIGNEMAPGARPSAYRAQAVAARTYGWIRLRRHGAGRAPFHVTDDQSSQVYTGLDPRYEARYEDMTRRTRETAGVVLSWENRPFPAYYSSTCGGHTTNARTSQLDPAGALGPLRGVKCGFCSGSPRFQWAKSVTDAQIVAGLKRRGRPILAPVQAIRISQRGTGGWAAEVTVIYGPQQKSRTLPGTEFRSALGLDSHFITGIRKKRGGWHLEGRGWGHGVGMCQWGALEMARRGSSESEILSWYYPGAAFTRVY